MFAEMLSMSSAADSMYVGKVLNLPVIDPPSPLDFRDQTIWALGYPATLQFNITSEYSGWITLNGEDAVSTIVGAAEF